MRRFNTIVIAGVALSMFAIGCERKEQPALEAPVQPTQQLPMQQAPLFTPPTSPNGNMGARIERTVVVSEDIKATWRSVKLFFEDRALKKSSEYVVNIGSEFNVPDTKLKIVVGEFLPDFTMGNSTITSNSNKPDNPAVRIEIFDDGASIFKGWLFANLPTVHPFEHERYKLILKEGLKK